MPNNKKNRKDKKNKAAACAAAAAATAARPASAAPPAAAAASAAVVGPTSAAEHLIFRCPHNPAACAQCIMAYPLGCLHSLRQEERMSPEINNLVIPVFHRFYQEKDIQFWERPENKPFVNENMVRFFFYQSIKFIIGKDSYLSADDSNSIYKTMAERTFLQMFHLYSVMKCGSHAAARLAVEEQDISLLDEAQVSIRALNRLFDRCDSRYYCFVYHLNELSPCNCLEIEVKHAKEEEEAQGRESLILGFCSNDDCDKKESPDDDDPFSLCAGCRMALYCSRRCYKDHWKGHMTSTESSHKIACEAFQELKSVLAGGGIRGSLFGDASSV